VFTAPGGPPVLVERGLPAGAPVRDLSIRPTVRVSLLKLADGRLAVCKRYCFPRMKQRRHGLLRHTFLGTPKPVREARNLLRLARLRVPVVSPIAWAVERNPLGVVRDGWVLTPWLSSSGNLQELMRREARIESETWVEIGGSIRKIHAAGCWYRTLCGRNLLIGKDRRSVRWIDPSKALWKPAPLRPSLAAADLRVFWSPWRERVGKTAWEAFREGYGEEGILPEWARPWSPAGGLRRGWVRKAVERELLRAAE